MDILLKIEKEVRSLKQKSVLLGNSIERNRKIKQKTLEEGMTDENELYGKKID